MDHKFPPSTYLQLAILPLLGCNQTGCLGQPWLHQRGLSKWPDLPSGLELLWEQAFLGRFRRKSYPEKPKPFHFCAPGPPFHLLGLARAGGTGVHCIKVSIHCWDSHFRAQPASGHSPAPFCSIPVCFSTAAPQSLPCDCSLTLPFCTVWEEEEECSHMLLVTYLHAFWNIYIFVQEYRKIYIYICAISRLLDLSMY